MKTDATPNHLLAEKSPYLQQHAYNPVEWYPWGEEAFERARREQKPIFLSIGYSTCHWCHVMERESFEDEATAKIMNERFINIKVDREERPDVDQVYMTAVQLTTRQGGWPLSAWLTPELKPFYLGTYFPPRPAYGRPSFQDVLLQLSQLWTSDRERVLTSAETLTDAVEKISVVGAAPRETTDDAIFEACFQQLEGSYESRHGGFGAAPKFPRPAIFEFLLRYHDLNKKTNEAAASRALQMTLHTARSMAAGGMYDQLGGGFARYSVDAEWRVPHFEKMLYDQGQLLSTFADLYRITGDEELARVIRQTVGYLERDLISPDGAFYSAEDADSEGEEGTFYVWTRDEIRELLSAEEAATVEIYYGITAEGNFEHGKNVLHTSATIERVTGLTGKSEAEVAEHLASAHRILFKVRSTRVRPHRDEKVLTSWNGLMISGLARAASALGEISFAALASRAADHLIDTMNVDGRLKRRQKDGEVKIDGYLDDYAFLAAGLLDLYETTFDEKYLREAERLTREAENLFGDSEQGGFYLTSGDDPSVLVRSKSDHDGAEPSGNSVMAMNLLRLGRMFHDTDFEQSAGRTIDLFLSRIAEYPMMMPLMVAAAISRSRPPRQIVIAASEEESRTAELVRSVQQAYLPETSLILVPPGGASEWLTGRAGSIEGMGPVDGQPAAYVCENFVCLRPVTKFDPEAIG